MSPKTLTYLLDSDFDGVEESASARVLPTGTDLTQIYCLAYDRQKALRTRVRLREDAFKARKRRLLKRVENNAPYRSVTERLGHTSHVVPVAEVPQEPDQQARYFLREGNGWFKSVLKVTGSTLFALGTCGVVLSGWATALERLYPTAAGTIDLTKATICGSYLISAGLSHMALKKAPVRLVRILVGTAVVSLVIYLGAEAITISTGTATSAGAFAATRSGVALDKLFLAITSCAAGFALAQVSLFSPILVSWLVDSATRSYDVACRKISAQLEGRHLEHELAWVESETASLEEADAALPKDVALLAYEVVAKVAAIYAAKAKQIRGWLNQKKLYPGDPERANAGLPPEIRCASVDALEGQVMEIENGTTVEVLWALLVSNLPYQLQPQKGISYHV